MSADPRPRTGAAARGGEAPGGGAAAAAGDTPLRKLRARAGGARDSGGKGKEGVVLLMTGGLCPVHTQHVEMMEKARHRLEEDGVCVLAGFLSPTHGAYTARKMDYSQYIATPLRQELAALATADSDWLDVDRWEGRQPRFVNFHEVRDRLEAHLRGPALGLPPLRVVYVAGGDRYDFHRILPAMVCVPRDGAARRGAPPAEVPGRVWVAREGCAAVSSTEIRRRLRGGRSCAGLLHPAVEARLRPGRLAPGR